MQNSIENSLATVACNITMIQKPDPEKVLPALSPGIDPDSTMHRTMPN